MINRMDFLTIVVTTHTRRKEVQMQISTPSLRRDIENRLVEFWLPHLTACEDLFTHLEYVDTSMKE